MEGLIFGILRYIFFAVSSCPKPAILRDVYLAVPWVAETFLARFLAGFCHASPLVVWACGQSCGGLNFDQHRKFPPHARKTSGTQGYLATTIYER